MKKLLFKLQMALVICLSLFVLVGCGSKETSELTYVTIETNPSIELVVNDKGVVVAVNGTNEDGKLLLNGEEFEGEKVEEVTEQIITLTEELGFAFKGTVDSESQTVEISVTANTVEVAKAIEEKVKNEVDATITELGLDAKLEVLEAKNREYFEKIVLAYDPTLTEEEAKAMTVEELLVRVNDATKEKAQFVSVKLEEYYLTLKEYEFKIYYKQEIANSIEAGYDALRESYSNLLQQFSQKIAELKELEVYTFTNPESSYVKAMNTYQEAKQKLMEQKVQLSVKVENGGSTALLEAQIGISEMALEAADKAVEAVDTTIKASFAAVITALETVYASLEELEKELPTDLNVEEKLTKAENYINTNKDALFEKFEESVNKENLEQLEADIKAKKAELKAKVEEEKKA